MQSLVEKSSDPGLAPLFRAEALDFQLSRRDWGVVTSLQPVSSKITVWLLVILSASLIGFLSLAQYARKETALGYLTPTKGTAKIFAPRRGTIKEVHVLEGQSVREGQTVLTIQTEQIAADGLDVNAAVLANSIALRDQLTTNIRHEEQRIHSERARLEALANGLELEITDFGEQIGFQKERLRILESELTIAAELRSKGHFTALEHGRRQLAVLEQQQLSRSLNQQLTQKKNQLTEIRFSLEQLPTVMAQKLQSLRTDLSNTEQRIAEIHARGAYAIRAPTSGRVTTLQAKAGRAADTERLQLEIVPNDIVLQAELFVPAKAIGFVEPGQSVRILYDAFPYQQFGTYAGNVVTVSKTLLTGADAIGPIKLAEPAYRVTAALERPDIDAHGKTVPLQPDMLLKADIILEKRTLLGWMLSPLRNIRM